MDKKTFTESESRESRWTISEPSVDDPTLVKCPKCAAKALIYPIAEEVVKAACNNCTYTAERSTRHKACYWYDENPTDGYFGLDLWLQVDCSGNSLWAFNKRHLNILEEFVNADLRQRNMDKQWGWYNSSLISRLPKWIKSSKNRELVSKGLKRLREKL